MEAVGVSYGRSVAATRDFFPVSQVQAVYRSDMRHSPPSHLDRYRSLRGRSAGVLSRALMMKRYLDRVETATVSL